MAKIEDLSMPDGVTVSDLKNNFSVALTEYAPAHRRALLLDSADRGKIWEAVKAKFPGYQILPDTNHVTYIKNNLLASIYTVGKSANILPTSAGDKEIVQQLNIALENIWATLGVARYQMKAGERAALLNYGLTQVGWNNNIVAGTGAAFRKGEVVLKNISPLKFMRDPFAESIETAAYCMTWDDYHESAILSNPVYKEAFKRLKEENALGVNSETPMTTSNDRVSSDPINKPHYHRVYTHWVNVAGAIHEIHLLNNTGILCVRKNIKPATFPFAELYCNEPAGDLIGTSEPSKIFANSLAYNLTSSIILTSEYRNQNPPKFINASSGINVGAFTKHGDDAGHTFVVNGNAKEAVSYHTYPTPSMQSISTMNYLVNDIKNVTGVDDRYTGRDTGSVLTTGGIESMLDQVTMIDAPKVENYEAYCKRLTQLLLGNLICHSAIKRTYFVKDKKKANVWNSVSIDFPKIDNDTLFSYELAISSELPKNKSRIEAQANHLMEMQMQYSGSGIEVDLITPDEWLMMQDIPMKEYMQERMGIQRTQSYTELVAQAVTQYSGLIQNGVDPEEAIAATADTLKNQGQPGAEEAVASQMDLLRGGSAQPQQQQSYGGGQSNYAENPQQKMQGWS